MKMKFMNGRFAFIPPVKTLPREITSLVSPRINNDPRITLAYSLFESFEEGNVLLYGTPRSGKTTAMIAESINRFEKYLIIEPTNEIATTTVKEACEKADHGNGLCHINIQANAKGCIKIRDMISEYPILKQLPVIPLPTLCYDCDRHEECSYDRILKVETDTIAGVSLTYHKLVALMLSDNPINKEILQKITSISKNVIFDECHRLEINKIKRVDIIESKKGYTTAYDFKQYDFININSSVRKLAELFKIILYASEIQKAADDVLNKANGKRYFEESLRRVIENPVYDPSPYIRKELYSNVHHEIVEIAKIMKDRLNILDLIQLYAMLAVVTASKIQICAVRDHGIIKVQLAAVDTVFGELIASFIKSMQARRRVILTSGTINNDFDYDSLFFTPVNKIIWGINGDPLNTCDRMHVYTDHKKCTVASGRKEYSIIETLPEIVTDILKIIKVYHNVKIVTINKEIAHKLHKLLKESGHNYGVDYYNSDKSLGVKCDSRVMITVGLAYKPANSFDAVTEDTDSSFTTLHNSIHSDTYQMMSRVKDPEGKEDSFVFMLRSNLTDVEKVVTWGVNRVVRSEITKTGGTVKSLSDRNPLQNQL